MKVSNLHKIFRESKFLSWRKPKDEHDETKLLLLLNDAL